MTDVTDPRDRRPRQPDHHDVIRLEREARRLRALALRDALAGLGRALRGLLSGAAAPKAGRTA